jgi:hypothetical protein
LTVLDLRTQALLQDVIRRQTRSLLQYVSDAFPWTAPEEQGEVEVIRGLVVEERAAASDLARFLQRQHVGVPYAGSYPQRFTTINFVSLDYLLPLLVKHEREALAALEQEAQQLEHPEARALLDRLLTIKRRHVTTLEDLAAKARPAAAVR